MGEAIGLGFKALPTYVATQLLVAVGLTLLLSVVVVLFQVSPAAGGLLGVAAVVGAAYASIKLSLVTPVIAIEKQLNPIAALLRSWKLTKGNSMLILAFFLLMIVVFVVVSLVAGLVFGAFMLLGEDFGLIVSALGNGVLTMVVVVVMTAALASVHRQLSGSGGDVGTAFD